jgi:uncharacterized protein (UPF0548 family)
VRFVRPSDPGSIDRLVDALRAVEPSYTEIGYTLAGTKPSGYRNNRYMAVLGQGPEAFELAVDGLRSWKAHRLPGIEVLPSETQIRSGATVIVTLGTPALSLAAPCRIVDVVDESSRWGFAYGTLPGHPEHGEEAFEVGISADGAVRFEITPFSRPGNQTVRLLGPVGRAIQMAATNGYLRALQRFVAQGN